MSPPVGTLQRVTPRRVAALGALLVLALAGCSSGGGSHAAPRASGSSSATAGAASPGAGPADALAPRDAVLASLTQLTATTYHFALKGAAVSGQGQADPAAKKLAATVTATAEGFPMTVDVVVIGPDGYAKADLGGHNQTLGIPTGWMHLDASKLNRGSALGLGPGGTDPGDTAGLFAGLGDVQRVDATHYKATIDLTKATGTWVDRDTVTRLGEKAKAVPATITVDGQGRLAAVQVDLSSVQPGLVLSATYSDYGAPVSIAKPSGSIVEAPDSVRQLLLG
jgi:hypothetical protein